MLSRRGFIISGICTVASTNAYGALPLSFKVITHNSLPDTADSLAANDALSYQHLTKHKNSWFRLVNNQQQFNAQIIDIRDMNCDERLEQFSVVLEASPSKIDYSGVYRVYHQSDVKLRNLTLYIERADDWQTSGRYVATYSTFKVA